MAPSLSAVICILMVLGCATDSVLWQRYTEKDFPAHVNFVTIRAGSVLGPEQRLAFGSWMVGFGKSKPLASYQCLPDTMCQITISNLRCDRADSVGVSCEMKLYDIAACKLIVPARHEAFTIQCPLDMSLEPKSNGEKERMNNTPPSNPRSAVEPEGGLPSTAL